MTALTRGATNRAGRGRQLRSNAPGDVWYVAFYSPVAAAGDYYVRTTRTFGTEAEAKRFANERLAEGCDVSAGTLNPHVPKQTIGSSQLEDWLNRTDAT